jgi:hypothetical protein
VMSRLFHLSLSFVMMLVPHAFAEDMPPGSAPSPSANSGLPLNPLRQIAEDHLKAFVEAPLFDPTRRLPPPAVIVAPPPPLPVVVQEEPPPNLHLLGVLQGDHDIAIVRNGDDPKTSTVSSGDHIGAWTVTILATAGVRLSNGSKVVEYALFAKPGDSAGSGAAAPETAFSAAPKYPRAAQNRAD